MWRPSLLCVAILLLATADGAAFFGGGAPPGRSKRPAARSAAKKKASWARPKPKADAAKPSFFRFEVPDLREKADEVIAAVPKTPDEAREALSSTWDTVREQARPGQVFLGFFAALTLSFSTVSWAGSVVAGFLTEGGRGEVVQRALLFGSILDSVRQGYVEDNVDVDRLFQTGVNAMLSTLDPYSTYENARQSEDLTVRTVGRYGGVGLTISRDGEDVVILGALEGFAFDAGVRAGDKIVSVDGAPVKGMAIDAVKTRLRGEPGSQVEVTVTREGSSQAALSFPLQRQLVRLRDIPLAAMMQSGVGYVKLDSFSEGTSDELAQAIIAFQRGGGLKSLVIDLRDNPGGLLDAAVSVAQQLVPQDTTIVSTAGRAYGDEGSSVSYRSAMPPLLSPGVRLVLLVNGNTASAAEIVSGVVQDVDRGVIVGEKTFGKGLVQVVEPLPGGAALKLTVAKYYTPSGRCIQAISYRDKQSVADSQKQQQQQPQEKPQAADGKGAAAPAAGEKDGQGGGGATTGGGAGGGSSAAPIFPADELDDADDEPFSYVGRRRLPQKFTEEERKTFYTKSGRAVKDGGGIVPDMAAAPRAVGELERALLQQGLFYRFAGEYLAAHVGTPAQQKQQLVASADSVYTEFVSFVKREEGKVDPKKDRPLLESPRVAAQLDALQKTLESSSPGAGGGASGGGRASKEVGVLRKMIRDEQLAQFATERSSLQQDVVEAVLGRLTPPSERLLAQLDTDPQVKAALELARDPQQYEQILSKPADAAASKMAPVVPEPGA